MPKSPPSLPITSDWKSTLRRWGAELRNLTYLAPFDFFSRSDWSPITLSSYTTGFAAGSLVFSNVTVEDSAYWVIDGGNICFISLELNFDIDSGTNAYVAFELPLPAPRTTSGQLLVARSGYGTSLSERFLVGGIIQDNLIYVPRRVDSSLNQWTTGTDNSIVLAGHYRIEV